MRTKILFSGLEREILVRLGQTVRLARLRRNLSQMDLAARMGVTRATVAALEGGHPGVGLGAVMKALTVFGYSSRLGELLAADPIGDEVDVADGRKRSGRHADVAPF